MHPKDAGSLAPPPLAVGDVFDEHSDLTFRLYHATGRFLHDTEMLVFHQIPHLQPGHPVGLGQWWPDLGKSGLVLRADDTRKHTAGYVDGKVALTNILCIGARTETRVPGNDPAKKLKYRIEIPALATMAGLDLESG